MLALRCSKLSDSTQKLRHKSAASGLAQAWRMAEQGCLSPRREDVIVPMSDHHLARAMAYPPDQHVAND